MTQRPNRRIRLPAAPLFARERRQEHSVLFEAGMPVLALSKGTSNVVLSCWGAV